jgi:hypothetical protein
VIGGLIINTARVLVPTLVFERQAKNSAKFTMYAKVSLQSAASTAYADQAKALKLPVSCGKNAQTHNNCVVKVQRVVCDTHLKLSSKYSLSQQANVLAQLWCLLRGQ